ncbi:MAG: YwaF family protein [Clostridia bacterium]|nr:YwaF family protein [Clostridia bacterium]
MNFWQNLLKILNSQMETPQAWGWFHLLFWGLSILFAVLLCVFHKKESPDRVRKVVFSVAITVIILEIYKQINYSFSYENGITFDYQWYAFPWQFCSTPMYVGLLAGIFKKGKFHDALCAFLATYAMFAGLCVMIYPNDIYTTTIGINIQTSICHGSMISVAIYLLYSGHVKLQHKTILKAMSVFACAMGIAMLLNEITYRCGLEETFNMFYISPHHPPHLPVYSSIQAVVPFPLCTVIYFAAFSLVAYLILLAAMGIKKIALFIQSKSQKNSASKKLEVLPAEEQNV